MSSRWGCVAVAVALWPSLALPRVGGPPLLAGVGSLALIVVGVARPGHAGSDRARRTSSGADGIRSLSRGTVDVRYVWDASYTGLRFPLRPTVVLRIRAPHRALYWRASTLDYFVGDRWIENLYPVAIGRPRRRAAARSAGARPRRGREASWVDQTVTVEALDDRHLVAATQPMRVDTDRLGSVFFLSGGVMVAPRGDLAEDRGTRSGATRRGRRHRSSPHRPPATRQRPAGTSTSVGRGCPCSESRAGSSPSTSSSARGATATSGPTGRCGSRPVVSPAGRRRRTSPPSRSSVAPNGWVRLRRTATTPSGRFPPLVDFALGARAATASTSPERWRLMLRTLGIPSRVAVGFTSGSWSKGEWTVTDHQAHAWVEAWFVGHGWLAFDPTPGRGTFSAQYSFAADSADAVRALGTGRLLDFSPQPGSPGAPQQAAPEALPPAAPTEVPLWPLAFLLVPVVGAGATLAVKRRRRTRRLSAEDPRERADGIRLELADALRDRGVPARHAQPLVELARAAERRLDVHADRLVELTETARYAPPEIAVPAARAATDELRRVEAAIVRRSGRLRATLAALRPGTLRSA